VLSRLYFLGIGISCCGEQTSSRLSRLLRGLLIFLSGTLIFALACTQAPLYYSNQNQYMLHGLAAGGRGLLHDDWLAGTADPTPVFSGGVAFTYLHMNEEWFYAAYALLQGLYLLGMTGIFLALAGRPASLATCCCFVALVTLTHAAVLRWLSWRLLSNDYPWFLQCGLAGQYLLGPVLQPSAFGVLLIVSVRCFINNRPFLAVVCSSVAAALHTTYMPGAALLTIAYLLVLSWERAWQTALGVGALALVIVVPTLVYSWQTFAPTSPEVFAQAQDILVHLRLPHHTEPRLWLDAIALGQIAWIGLAWWLTRRTRLASVLGIVALLTFALSVAQVATGNDTLALLFPWRTTAYLVPIATAVVLARLVQTLAGRPTSAPGGQQPLLIGSVALMLLLALGGVGLLFSGQAYPTAADELPVLDYIGAHKQPGDLYLVPITLPDPPERPKSSDSIDFKPAPPADTVRPARPFDLQRFRLYTSAPLFVDFKAIPYKDTEVLEWHQRIDWAHGFYQHLGEESLGRLADELRQRGITHVLVRGGQDLRSRELTKIFQGGAYTLYRVMGPTSIDTAAQK
jgi:uncharacterized membrane protein